MKKKVFLFALLLLSSFAFVGCGSESLSKVNRLSDLVNPSSTSGDDLLDENGVDEATDPTNGADDLLDENGVDEAADPTNGADDVLDEMGVDASEPVSYKEALNALFTNYVNQYKALEEKYEALYDQKVTEILGEETVALFTTVEEKEDALKEACDLLKQNDTYKAVSKKLHKLECQLQWLDETEDSEEYASVSAAIAEIVATFDEQTLGLYNQVKTLKAEIEVLEDQIYTAVEANEEALEAAYAEVENAYNEELTALLNDFYDALSLLKQTFIDEFAPHHGECDNKPQGDKWHGDKHHEDWDDKFEDEEFDEDYYKNDEFFGQDEYYGHEQPNHGPHHHGK